MQLGAPPRRHPLLPSTRPRGRARRPRGGAATAHRSGVDRRDRRPAGDAAGRGGATGRSAADRRDGGCRRRDGVDAGRTCRGHGPPASCSSDGSTRPSPCLARLPSSRPACRGGSAGGGSPCTSSTKPMPWPTAVGTPRLGTCSCRPPNGPAAANAAGAWVWFEMVLAEIARDTGRAREAIRRLRCRRRGGAVGWAGRRARVGPRRRGAGAPAARRARAGGRGPAARRRRRGKPGRHVGRHAGASAALARRLPRRPGGGPGAHPRGRRGWPDATRCYLLELGALSDLVRLGAPGEAVDRLRELARQIGRGARPGPRRARAEAHGGAGRRAARRRRGPLRADRRPRPRGRGGGRAGRAAPVRGGDAGWPPRPSSDLPSWPPGPAGSTRRSSPVAPASNR